MRIFVFTRKQLILAIAVLFAITGTLLFFWGQQPTLAVSQSDTGIKVPILMYHSILKDPQRTGDYVISPEQLEKDLIYLQNHGYTTVLLADLIAYVHEGTPLPDKPIVLTFDDGYYNNLVYLLPLLEKYQMKAVVAVVGEYVQRFSDTKDPNPNYAHLNWDDIKTLQQSGLVEIQNHSYSMHEQKGRKGAGRMRGESVEAYTQALKADLGKLQEAMKEHTGTVPNTFVYPFGQVSKESLSVLKELGFQASLSCYEKTNVLTRDPECLYSLCRFNRPGALPSEVFMERLEKAQ